VLYVARALSWLEFQCWRTVLAREDPPVPVLANGLSRRASPETFARLLGAGRSAMLFLRRPPGAAARPTFDGPYAERVLDTVRGGAPVVAVPLVFVWGTSGVRDSGARGWVDNLVGAEHEPGPLRRLGQLIWRRGRAFLRVADPVEVREFLAAAATDREDLQARRLRFEVSGRIERERRVAFGPPLKSGRRMRDEVLRSRRVARAVAEAAARIGPKRARRRAERHARDIAADIRPWALRLWSAVLHAVFARMYEGIDADEAGLERVRAAARRAPVVFVPSHRSHVDYLVLSYVLHDHGLFPPHIAAGANLDFFPVGTFFRWGGGFFVRRTTTDRLYAAVFREYVRRLLRSGHSIEFFIEGGRSRTGKVLEPKLGLLSILVEAVQEGDVPTLQIVPVAIGYERVLEEASYAAELAGAAKRQEDLGAMLRATRVLASHHGRLDVQFDEPFDLRELLESRAAEGSTGARAPLMSVARRIVWGIGRVTAVTPTGLVATALLATGKREIERAELIASAASLYRAAGAAGARIAAALRGAEGPNEAAIDRAVDILEEDGLVRIRGTSDAPLYAVVERQRLDYYRNSVRQTLAGPALAATALRAHAAAGDAPMGDDALRERTQFLARLFDSEFVFEQGEWGGAVFDRVLTGLVEAGVVSRSTAGAAGVAVADVRALDLLAGTVRDLIEAYWVAARALDLLGDGSMAKRDWVAQAYALGERLHLQRAVTRPEGLSRATLQSALARFREVGAVRDLDGALRAEPAAAELRREIESYLS
jgi:glycerol-3-phosphate O-acyltransferase